MAAAEPKDFSSPMESAYHPLEVETGWVEWWEKKKFFEGDAAAAKDAQEDNKFVIVIPPPNVTGSLHLGHTLTLAIEDTLVRWHRMRGDATMWFPGVDHAGIATQTVVERRLLKDGVMRHDLGRDAFISKVWEWKEMNGSKISQQMRRLGVSVDWTRESFTMDEARSTAVTEAFVRMYEKGLIFRADRLVSWCPYLQTALSDIEVDPEEVEKPAKTRVPGFDKTVEVGVLWKFSYPIDGSGKRIEVATTRIETMLGDTAVAVHPEDPRYKEFIGKRLVHPFFPDREMFVIGDDHCDPDFGTGAVKITPAHDKNDFEIGMRHSLPFITIFTRDGKINENGGPFVGMHRFECRFKIEKELRDKGLLGDKIPNERKMQLPRCSRSNDIIEYMMMPQWWVDCKDLARAATQAVRDKELEIIPSNFEQVWFNWLDNIKDWCVSRQLWWGHRVPAYKVLKPPQERELWAVGRSEEEARQKAAEQLGLESVEGVEVQQDEDVLDTWFSSGIFPLSVSGWPKDTQDFDAFFPTTLLETGHDILFFWVARMVMMSLHLVGKLPFKTIYLHAMVRDAHGKKMSKSLGNVVDPLEAIEGITLQEMLDKLKQGNLQEKELVRATDALKKDFPKGIAECGADALRYGLLAYTKAGRSLNLDINRVVGYRHFCNKLWNATKFSLMNFPPGFQAKGITADLKLQWADKWILHRLGFCCNLTNEALSSYTFSDAVTSTYNFWLYELCDVYLELLKPRLAAAPDDRGALETLYTCLDVGLRLLSPMTPFVTEELYRRIPPSAWKADAISIAKYPEAQEAWIDNTKDPEMTLLMSVVRKYRSLCAQLDIPPKLRPNGVVRTRDPDDDESCGAAFLLQRVNDIATLAKFNEVQVLKRDDNEPKNWVSDVVSDKVEVWVDPAGVVNMEQTTAKLQKKLTANDKLLANYRKKMDDAGYDTKVPPEIRQTNTEKVEQLTAECEALNRAKKNLESILSAPS